MNWTLKAGELEKTFADWGLANAKIRLVSQGEDSVAFVGPGLAFDADPLLAIGAGIEVWRDREPSDEGFTGGTRVFVGEVTAVPVFGSGREEGQGYQCLGPWQALNELVFQQTWFLAVDPEDPDSSIVGGLQSRATLFQGQNGLKQSLGTQIAEVVAYAVSKGVQIQLASDVVTNFPVTPPFDGVLDATCAEVLKKCLRWAPDAVTWFDYATTPPTLHVARRAQLAAAEVACVGAPLESFNLRARPDLVAPCVVLKYERVHTVDGIAWREIVRDIFPEDADEGQRRALVATIDLEGSSTTRTYASIECRAFAPGARSWWAARYSPMRDERVTLDRFAGWWLEFDDESILMPDGFVIGPAGCAASRVTLEQLQYELVKGQVAPWMLGAGAKVVSATVRAEMDYTFYRGEGLEQSVKKKVTTARVTLTSLPSGTYSTVEAATPAEDVPTGLAQQLYAAAGELHFEGGVTLTDRECPVFALGKALNLTGGRAEWASMRALVQSIDLDIDAGKTQLRFGPPTHLGPDDLIELLRFNRQRRVVLGFSSRASGKSVLGDGGLGEATANHDTSGDDGVLGKTVIAENGVLSGFEDVIGTLLERRIILDPAGLKVDPGNSTAYFTEIEVNHYPDPEGSPILRRMRVLGQPLNAEA